MSATPFELVLDKLDVKQRNGSTASAICPAHPDRDPSLSVKEGDDGRVLMHCHAGCDVADVARSIGLEPRDLFLPAKQQTNGGRREVCRYPYVDQDSKLLFNVVRTDPKGFHQVPANGKTGRGAMSGVPLVLYRLPELIEAVAAGKTVFMPEGEKDVDALVAMGHVATCGPMGAGKWGKVADLATEVLSDADVAIVADDDAAGIAHARDVARSLRGVAAHVTVVKAAVGKDAADHLGAGRTIEEFVPVASTDPTVVDVTLDDWLAVDEVADDDEPLFDPSFDPIDLAPVLAGDVAQPTPFLLTREDGQSLFYEAAINGFHGDSGVGKSWLILLAIAQQLRRGHAVMLIDAEDNEQSIVSRLRLLGATDDEIAAQLVYVRPQAPFGLFAVQHLLEIIEQRQVKLVAIDSLGECFGLDGIDENSDAEVGPWLRRVARKLAEAGPAVVLADHSTKANDNPLHPSGSKRKRAAIGGASYLVTATQPLAAGKTGRLRLVCAKDRHGTYARGEHVADLVMTSTPTGGVVVRLWPGSNAEPEPIIEIAARAAVQAARAEGKPMSQRSLVAAMKVKARLDAKKGGIDIAVGRGLLAESAGPNRARLFEYVYEPAEDNK